MFRTTLYILVFALLISACSPSGPSPLATPSLPALGETWTIKMNQSGGIMGLSRSVEISSDGKFTVTDDRTDQKVEGQLTDDELTQLRDLAANTKLTTTPETESAGCADCFVYTIEIQNGKSFNTQLNDISLPGSGLESLVAFLRDLMDKALK